MAPPAAASVVLVSPPRKLCLDDLNGALQGVEMSLENETESKEKLKELVRACTRLDRTSAHSEDDVKFRRLLGESASTLVRLMERSSATKEDRCFASTALATILLKHASGEGPALVFHSLLFSETKCRVRFERVDGSTTSYFKVFLGDQSPDSGAKLKLTTDFVSVVLHGICGKKMHDALRARLDGELALIIFFEPLRDLCLQQPTSAVFRYLLQWMEVAVKVLHSDADPKPSESESKRLREMVVEVYRLVTLNWDNTCNGVTDIVQGILSRVFETWLKDDFFDGMVAYYALCPEIVLRSRATLFVVASLVEVLEVEKVMNNFAGVGPVLLDCLKKPSLASSATAVYRKMVKRLPWHEWKLMFETAVGGAVRNEACRAVLLHWLPPTFEAYKSDDDCVRYFFNLVYPPSTERALRSLLYILKLSMNMGLRQMSVKSLYACGYLECESPQLRLDAFAVLCEPAHGAALSDLPSVRELEVVGDFLADNVYVDDPPFRADLLKAARKLFARLRCGMERLAFDEDASSDPKFVASANLIWRVVCLFKSDCHAAARYPRRAATLGLLSALLSTLLPEYQFLVKGINCEPARRDALRAKLLAMGRSWEFRDDWALRAALLRCVADDAPEIRSMASDLISLYFVLDPETIGKCRDAAAAMMKSPKQQVVDSGASLSCCVLRQLLKDVDDSDSDEPTKFSPSAYWNDAVQHLENDLDVARSNLEEAVSCRAVHGNFVHLRQILPLLQARDPGVDFRRTVGLTRRVVDYSLKLLGRAEGECPSFEEMGHAVQLVEESFLDDNENVAGGDLMITSRQQLILSFAWLNLKESVLFLGELAVGLLAARKGEALALSVDDVREMADILRTVLLFSRHKGAIESGAVAVGRFTRAVLECPDPAYHDVVVDLLESSLQMLSSSERRVSRTRRGAGFPLLIRSIVANEPKRFHHRLFERAVSFLCDLREGDAQQSLESMGLDVPEVIAMFVLSKLVEDARLVAPVLKNAPKLFAKSVDHLNSGYFSKRNAALLLFGCLTKRLFRQLNDASPKADDDVDESEGYGFVEFRMKYPEIVSGLFEAVRSAAADAGPRPGRHASVVPILVFLAKLDFRCSVLDPASVADAAAAASLGDWDDAEARLWRAALEPLVSSPVVAVRRLAARCWAQMLRARRAPGELLRRYAALAALWKRHVNKAGNRCEVIFVESLGVGEQAGGGGTCGEASEPEPAAAGDAPGAALRTWNDVHGSLLVMQRLLLCVKKSDLSPGQYGPMWRTLKEISCDLKPVEVPRLVCAEALRVRRTMYPIFIEKKSFRSSCNGGSEELSVLLRKQDDYGNRRSCSSLDELIMCEYYFRFIRKGTRENPLEMCRHLSHSERSELLQYWLGGNAVLPEPGSNSASRFAFDGGDVRPEPASGAGNDDDALAVSRMVAAHDPGTLAWKEELLKFVLAVWKHEDACVFAPKDGLDATSLERERADVRLKRQTLLTEFVSSLRDLVGVRGRHLLRVLIDSAPTLPSWLVARNFPLHKVLVDLKFEEGDDLCNAVQRLVFGLDPEAAAGAGPDPEDGGPDLAQFAAWLKGNKASSVVGAASCFSSAGCSEFGLNVEGEGPEPAGGGGGGGDDDDDDDDEPMSAEALASIAIAGAVDAAYAPVGTDAEFYNRCAFVVSISACSDDAVARLGAARALRLLRPDHAAFDSGDTVGGLVATCDSLLVLLFDGCPAVRREAARACSNLLGIYKDLPLTEFRHAAPALKLLVRYMSIRLPPVLRISLALRRLMNADDVSVACRTGAATATSAPLFGRNLEESARELWAVDHVLCRLASEAVAELSPSEAEPLFVRVVRVARMISGVRTRARCVGDGDGGIFKPSPRDVVLRLRLEYLLRLRDALKELVPNLPLTEARDKADMFRR